MAIEIITQGTCCRYEWVLLEEICLTDFLSRFSYLLRKMYCIQTSSAPQVKGFLNDDNWEMVRKDNDGNVFYLHPQFGLRTKEEFNQSGTWIFYQYPDSRYDGVVPRFERNEIPFLHAADPEYYSALPDFWQFVHDNRFDLLLVTLPDDQLFMTWPAAGAGFWINAEIEAGDEPPF